MQQAQTAPSRNAALSTRYSPHRVGPGSDTALVAGTELLGLRWLGLVLRLGQEVRSRRRFLGASGRADRMNMRIHSPRFRMNMLIHLQCHGDYAMPFRLF